MNNDVLLVPITVEQPNVEAQSDIVVYVPQAHKNKAGIVKEGEGIIIENGVASLDKTLVQDMVDAVDEALTDEISDVDDKIVAHINDFENPHRVTKSQIGLSNVNNTSDENKPISNATQRELKRLEHMISGERGALVYANYSEMVESLNADKNTMYGLGQSIFIGTREVPDLWIYGVSSEYVKYEYVSDDIIESVLRYDGTIRVGHYVLAALESNQIVLDNVVTTDTEQTITAIKTMDYSGEDGDSRVVLYPQNFLIYNGNAEFGYLNVFHLYGQTTLESSDTVSIGRPFKKYTTQEGKRIQTRDVSIEMSSRGTKLTTRSPDVYENASVLYIKPDGVYYNDKEIATKDDIPSGGGTSVEIVWWED